MLTPDGYAGGHRTPHPLKHNLVHFEPFELEPMIWLGSFKRLEPIKPVLGYMAAILFGSNGFAATDARIPKLTFSGAVSQASMNWTKSSFATAMPIKFPFH